MFGNYKPVNVCICKFTHFHWNSLFAVLYIYVIFFVLFVGFRFLIFFVPFVKFSCLTVFLIVIYNYVFSIRTWSKKRNSKLFNNRFLFLLIHIRFFGCFVIFIFMKHNYYPRKYYTFISCLCTFSIHNYVMFVPIFFFFNNRYR